MTGLTADELIARLDFGAGQTVLLPEAPVPGSWVGGPSAVVRDGTIHLAYRLRRPIGRGRGFANVIARTTDGITLETLAVIERDRHRADSLERPCLVRLPDGRWRLYLSCATPGGKHWRVDLLEGDAIQDLPDAMPRTVLPGDIGGSAAGGGAGVAGVGVAGVGGGGVGGGGVGVKDPVVVFDDGCWHLWASCHPLADPEATDRMTTDHATSTDGVNWQWRGTALRGTPGAWDSRGVRFTAVMPAESGWVAFYDGRASASENWEERTGAAVAASLYGPWAPLPGPVFSCPAGSGGLRYLCAVADPLDPGCTRIYYESARADGSHEMRTQLLRA